MQYTGLFVFFWTHLFNTHVHLPQTLNEDRNTRNGKRMIIFAAVICLSYSGIYCGTQPLLPALQVGLGITNVT